MIWSRFAVLAAALLLAACRREGADTVVRLKLPEDAHVSIVVENSSGKKVRELLVDQPLGKGPHSLAWDGKDDAGTLVAPGRYRWRGAFHRGIAAKLRGWACAGLAPAWTNADAVNPRRGGAPTAVAADAERVYLAWDNGNIRSCDLNYRAGWSAELGEGRSCAALAVDQGIVFALARREGAVAKDEIVRFDARSGAPVPWPTKPVLAITDLWPADSQTKTARADSMCVRAGHLYLTFTNEQFIAVIDARSGAYLQTVVGPVPAFIDATPTKTESPDRPGELIDADFVVVALQGGVLGKVLFAHDPLWVMTSDMQPLDSGERITALTLLGDGAKHHRHSVFVGLDAPFRQVQRRSVLDTQGFEWSAGSSGGRPTSGPWNPEAMGPIRGVALDAEGRLWVAEGDAVPPRFSVWSTDGNEGRIIREIFGPLPEAQFGVALLPDDPDVLIGAGCEWRIDPKTGEARCLGVITQETMVAAEFAKDEDGKLELHITKSNDELRIVERRGEGDYVPQSKTSEIASSPETTAISGQARMAAGIVTFAAEGIVPWTAMLDGKLQLARLFADGSPSPNPPAVTPGADISRAAPPRSGTIMQGAGGRVYAAAAGNALWSFEITGLDTVRSLPGGELTVSSAAP